MFRFQGYRSFEAFIDAVSKVNAGEAVPEDFDHGLATIGTTFLTTAMLEAGRLSLDHGGRPFIIEYGQADGPFSITPVALVPASYPTKRALH